MITKNKISSAKVELGCIKENVDAINNELDKAISTNWYSSDYIREKINSIQFCLKNLEYDLAKGQDSEN